MIGNGLSNHQLLFQEHIVCSFTLRAMQCGVAMHEITYAMHSKQAICVKLMRT